MKNISFVLLSAFLIISIAECLSATANLREELGLVAFWTLDQETINKNSVDDTFGENSGNITGNPKLIAGAIGEALSFDGAVDYVRMINDIFFPSVSMEAIIRPTLGTRNPIYDKYNYGIQLLDSDQVGIWIRADTANEANHWISAYTPFPTDGQWHHVVGVVEDQENIRIYLDGELKAKTPAPDPVSMAYGAQVKPSIAYTQHLGGIWYEGNIDEVAVYEGALSDTDVKRLYADALSIEPETKLILTWGKLKHR
jgi:hypothetical protein